MPLSAQGYISSGYRQHDSLFVKALSDLFQWSRVKCRKFDRLEREMNPASNFACYRTMFKVATESNGGRVSKCISLRLPLRFKGVQDTQSLNPLRSWWNNTGRPLVPATWSYFEQCVSLPATRTVSLPTAIFVCLQVFWGLSVLGFRCGSTVFPHTRLRDMKFSYMALSKLTSRATHVSRILLLDFCISTMNYKLNLPQYFAQQWQKDNAYMM